jgi:outer membrane protein OmpA-like peptidoglycan-associated protein
MDESGSSEHLSSSLTDLMTSLMVIFILLLLVFISGSASEISRVREVILEELKQKLDPKGFGKDSVRSDPNDPAAILVIVPNKLMNFELGSAELGDQGSVFLKAHIHQLAQIVCNAEFKESVDSVVVEGYSDESGFRGMDKEKSESENLKLSQQRSMQVVASALEDLHGYPDERSCFLNKLSASGRGQQDQLDNPENSRRVVFKIRVKARDISEVVKELK